MLLLLHRLVGELVCHESPYLDRLSAFAVRSMMSTCRGGCAPLTHLGVVSSEQDCFYIPHISYINGPTEL